MLVAYMLEQDLQQFRRPGRDLRVLDAWLQFGGVLVRIVDGFRHRLHQALAVFRADEPAGNRAKLAIVVF